MSKRTHIVVQTPNEESFRTSVHRLDTVVDLSWEQHLAGWDWLEKSTDEVFATGVNTPQQFEAAKDEILSWLVSLTRTRFGGKTLADWFRHDEHLSLWWTHGLMVKPFPRLDLTRLFVAILWLNGQTAEDPRARDALQGSDKLIIWADRHRLADSLASGLTRHFPNAEIATHTRDGASREHGAWKLARRWFRVLVDLVMAEVFALRNQLGQAFETTVPQDGAIDILVPTIPTSWSRGSGSDELTHRYLGEFVDRVRAEGLNLVFVPACPGGRTLEHFHRRLGEDATMMRWDLLDTRPGVATRILIRLLAMRWRQGALLRALQTSPVLEHRGFNLRQWLLDARDSQTLNGGFQNAYLYELVHHAIEEGAPNVVLYKDEFYASGRAVSAAVPEETTSWAFEHGPMNKTYMVYINDGQWVGPVGERRAEFMPAPDLFLCYGEFAREIVTQRGYPEDRVRPIGSFRHDALFRQSGERVAPEELGLPADRHILTVCGQLPKEIPHWLRCLVGGIRLSGLDCHVVVKPHPRYDVRELCTRMFEELGFVHYSFEMDRLHDLMKGSAVVLTGNSTTGLESLALGVPLIVFMDPGGFEQIPYVEEGAGLSAHDPESMREALELLLTGHDPLAGRRDEFLRRHLSPSAGHAIDAFLKLYADTFGEEDR